MTDAAFAVDFSPLLRDGGKFEVYKSEILTVSVKLLDTSFFRMIYVHIRFPVGVIEIKTGISGKPRIIDRDNWRNPPTNVERSARGATRPDGRERELGSRLAILRL